MFALNYDSIQSIKNRPQALLRVENFLHNSSVMATVVDKKDWDERSRPNSDVGEAKWDLKHYMGGLPVTTNNCQPIVTLDTLSPDDAFVPLHLNPSINSSALLGRLGLIRWTTSIPRLLLCAESPG